MRSRFIVWIFAAITAVIVASPRTAIAADPDRTHVDGTLAVVWGDGPPWNPGSHVVLRLAADDGRTLTLDAAGLEGRIVGSPSTLNRRRVRVWHEPLRRPPLDGDRIRAVAVAPLEPEPERSVTGSQVWVSLLCRFPDVAASSTGVGYFQGMFDNAPGRLDHYWREVSYGAIDTVGSTASDWLALPHSQTFYAPTPGSGCPNGVDLDSLFSDCVAAHDPVVDFSNGGVPFDGINLMFNSDLDGCAYGGSRTATLDGVTRHWGVTWEPPWGWGNLSVMAHEMGHGFGLPHSNNWDDDGSPYDNSWDVMSDTWHWYGTDPVYGVLGKHTIGYHKDVLGWIPPGERFEAPDDSLSTIILDDLAAATTSSYRIAVIPIGGGGEQYTVEARRRSGVYDGALPGEAVIIHHVLPSRTQPAWAYDAAVPPGDFADGEGVMWRVGETFTDAPNEITVTVEAATATGFRVTIGRGDTGLVFSDGFEAGTLGAWSDAAP